MIRQQSADVRVCLRYDNRIVLQENRIAATVVNFNDKFIFAANVKRHRHERFIFQRDNARIPAAVE